jgi:lipopolysaccharide transport system ATP-binding protein
MSRPIIEVRSLSKQYRLGTIGATSLREEFNRWVDRLRHRAPAADRREFWALRDVSFEVSPGEVVGIIGRNGAGKSTLLKILSRITEPTAGEALLRGRVASLLEIGTGFHPELTGRENIFLNGAILGMTRAEVRRKLDEIVSFAEIEKFIDTPVKRYSSGMHVRLGFAVAAHLEPEILIVDEVLSVGDYAFQRKCLGKMEEVSRGGGRTVLFVSHNLGSVTGLCGRAAWLAQGRIQSIGPADEVVAEYVRSQTEETRSDYDFRAWSGGDRRSGRLVITSLRVNDGAAVMHGEPFRARLFFQARAPVEGVAFALSFCTIEGTILATYDSDRGGPRHTFSAGDEGAIELRLPELPLGPGRYALSLGARSGDAAPLDHLPACGVIDVQPGPRTHVGLVHAPGSGLRLTAEWVSPAAGSP